VPIYEYVCPKCELKFELLRPMSQRDEAVSCPNCKGKAKRVPSSFACFSKDDGGSASSVGGSSCSGCSSTDCSTCGG